MPKFSVVHLTNYIYPSDVTDSANQVILYPKSTEYQQVLENRLTIVPSVNIDTFEDYFGNQVGMFTIVEPHRELEIRLDLEVDTKPAPLPVSDLVIPEQWAALEQLRWEYPYADFLQAEQHIEQRNEIQHVFDQLVSREAAVADVAFALSSYIYQNFTYQQGVTTIESTVDEIWRLKAGVCQDFAHLLIAMLRILGVPARYISGYISPSDIEMRGEGATHAWVEVFVPSFGWAGIDPTNDCWVSDRHIRIAYGRDFKDCTPVKGTYKGPSDHTLTVSVVITNEHTKETTVVPPVKSPAYVSVTPAQTKAQANSYQRYLEMQQQQQQQ